VIGNRGETGVVFSSQRELISHASDSRHTISTQQQSLVGLTSLFTTQFPRTSTPNRSTAAIKDASLLTLLVLPDSPPFVDDDEEEEEATGGGWLVLVLVLVLVEEEAPEEDLKFLSAAVRSAVMTS
jgi:hypothetical protein